MRPPAHLVRSGAGGRHGVSRLAGQIAAALGARVVYEIEEAAAHPRVHAHVTDRLFGSTPEEAADQLVSLGRRTHLTVTLHDVPQPTDGRGFERRRDCYRRVLDAVAGWATNSEAEQRTVVAHCEPRGPGAVVPLPVRIPTPRRDAVRPVAPGDAVVGVFGFVYPGKGHVEALEACAPLGASRSTRPTVVALGAAADGHAGLIQELRCRADEVGVRFDCTGWLEEDEVDARLAAVTVAFAAHHNVSASGSVNSWLAAGHRPLVRESAYAREVARLRPGTLELYAADAAPEHLSGLIRRRLARPELGAVPPGAAWPLLEDVASHYRNWWDR